MRNSLEMQDRMEQRGMTIDVLAARVGVSPTSLQRVLDGSRPPTIGLENRIRAALGYSELKPCPACKGTGRVDQTAPEGDIAARFEHSKSELAATQERNARLRASLRDVQSRQEHLRADVKRALVGLEGGDAQAVSELLEAALLWRPPE